MIYQYFFDENDYSLPCCSPTDLGVNKCLQSLIVFYFDLVFQFFVAPQIKDLEILLFFEPVDVQVHFYGVGEGEAVEILFLIDRKKLRLLDIGGVQEVEAEGHWQAVFDY